MDTSTTALSTTIIGSKGTLWLHGWRESYDGTARFRLTNVDGTEVLLDNASWSAAWRFIVDNGAYKAQDVDGLLRSVLPTP